MKQYIVERVVAVADYITQNNSTVRATAKEFCVSKSTIHKDMSQRLYYIDKNRFNDVKKVLGINLQERHIRGGISTKQKYLKMKRKPM